MLRKIGGSDCWILSVYFGRMVSSLFDDVVQFRTAHMTVRGYHTVPMNLKLHVSPSLVNILQCRTATNFVDQEFEDVKRVYCM